MFTPSMKWFKLKEVRNEKYSGHHWERVACVILKGESNEHYRERWREVGKGIWIGNGVETLFLLGYGTRVVHIGISRQIENMLRYARVKRKSGQLPHWEWVAITQGGDLEHRRMRWEHKYGKPRRLKVEVMKQPQMTKEDMAVFEARAQEQRRTYAMAEAKRRKEEYDKKFQETLAAGDIPEAPDWQ